jgi:hypothetical protein
MTTVGISDLHPYSDTTGTLVVTYEGKAALVELEGLGPRYPREPRQEICRRAMLELIQSLSEWEQSGAAITWHAVNRGK